MSNVSTTSWKTKQTEQSHEVERVLREAGFRNADAYRYNSASIRVRVIDPQFRDLSLAQRDALLSPHLEKLPEEIQRDIIDLFVFSPEEISPDNNDALRERLMNLEFEDPSPSRL